MLYYGKYGDRVPAPMFCANCGGKANHPYDSIGNKKFCSLACYEAGLADQKEKCTRCLDNSQDGYTGKK